MLQFVGGFSVGFSKMLFLFQKLAAVGTFHPIKKKWTEVCLLKILALLFGFIWGCYVSLIFLGAFVYSWFLVYCALLSTKGSGRWVVKVVCRNILLLKSCKSVRCFGRSRKRAGAFCSFFRKNDSGLKKGCTFATSNGNALCAVDSTQARGCWRLKRLIISIVFNNINE